MRAPQMLFWLPIVLAAQTAPPAALIRGTLLERDPQTAAGEFSVRVPDHQVFRYQFDGKTYVERDQQPIDVARLRLGETVEVLSDEAPGSVLRYARSVHVLNEPDPAPPRARSRLRARSFDNVVPRSTMDFSGVVFQLNAGRVVIHTRDSGDQTILLRDDTRFLENGRLVDAGDLRPNMRVYVRAGKTLYNEIEAYQVIWGQILMPR